MISGPRQVCLSVGGGHVDDLFAPEAVGASYQQVMRLMQFRRTDRLADELIAEFDLLR